jgi:hypothetical protein
MLFWKSGKFRGSELEAQVARNSQLSAHREHLEGSHLKSALFSAHLKHKGKEEAMSDLSLPLTSPVFLTDLEDVDVHARYCELLKAYETVVQLRDEEKKQAHRTINAIQTAAERLGNMQLKAGTRRSTGQIAVRSGTVADQDLRIHVLESKVELLQAGLEESRGYCAEVEQDLKTALEDGVRYRDNLKKMIELRERETSKRLQEDEAASAAATAELQAVLQVLSKTKTELENEKSESNNLRQTLRELTAKAFAKELNANEEAQLLQSQLADMKRQVEELTEQGSKAAHGTSYSSQNGQSRKHAACSMGCSFSLPFCKRFAARGCLFSFAGSCLVSFGMH